MGAVGVSLWGAVGVLVLLALVFVTGQKANAQDLVVLSHRFDDSQFSSEIIGEIMNNDTRSYDKYDVSIYANFRDPAGALVSSEEGFIDAERLGVGDSSAFNIYLFDDSIADRASTYDLIINDERLVSGQPLDRSGEESDDVGTGGGPLEELGDQLGFNDNGDNDNNGEGSDDGGADDNDGGDGGNNVDDDGDDNSE